jgi:perosamine synthetase
LEKIKLFDPVVSKEEKEIIKVLKSHFWASGAGINNVLKFENQFQKYINSTSSVAVNSGTAALHLALNLAEIKNKEVIVPSLSFVSTAHSIVYNGGIPIFVDVNPETLCIDIESIKEKITNKTVAVLPVHFAGTPCDLNEIKKMCNKYKIMSIEDAAHAAGSTYKNKKIGSHGEMVCFSFHPVKNLAMPTGGAITLNGNKTNVRKKNLNSLRWCGISNRKETTYDVSHLGWNYYMNEFSAAIGRIQLKRLDSMNKIRKNTAKRYSEEIGISDKMQFSKDCSYHFYWIKVKKREKFMKKLKENKIETGIHYKPIHKMSYYNEKISLPNSEYAGEHIVSLPTHPNLSEKEISKIIKLVNKFL